MSDRIIPLADAPAPKADASLPDDPGAESPQDAPFTADPLNTLKFKPQLVEAVSKVFDPEIPVNIYELGLVYDLDVDGASNVHVRMTLTAPACPAAQTIPVDVERRLREVPGVNEVKVSVVWDPPWTREMMSDSARLTLGMY